MLDARYSPDLLSAAAHKTYYALTMFPYPSGIGLHCGHASNYTINDVMARYKRMQGYTVLNPIGFDAFGLPTENYAIQQGKPAREVTDANKLHFLEQLKALNMSFDYNRVLDTSEPEYYKWTQRIFSKLYEAGLVYRDTLWVNRCPSCMTVLANDQVVDSKCERCKSEIIQKKHPQRFIKITDYADRLIDDLDDLDRPEETKIAQKNRIGRSEGAEIDFTVYPHPSPLPTGGTSSTAPLGEGVRVTCFTTRPDTIYGVTALVLAPENTLLDSLLNDNKRQEVEEYRQKTLSKTAVQRQQDLKKKTGVDSGLYAIHPLTHEQIPVWYADYVLAGYGSGAVMSVPAHDERDHEFAQKFGIEIREVIDGNIDDCNGLIKDGFLNELNGVYQLYDCETARGMIVDDLEMNGHGRKKITYKLRDRSVSRQRYWGSPIPVYYAQPKNKKVPLKVFDEGVWAFKKDEKVLPRKTILAILYDKNNDTYAVISRTGLDTYTFVLGGIDDGETPVETARREIIEETGYTNFVLKSKICDFQTKFRHKVKQRNQFNSTQAFLFELADDENTGTSLEEDEKLELKRMSKQEILDMSEVEDIMKYALRVATGDGSDRDGEKSDWYNEYNAIPEPVSHLVPESELPVVLPLDLEEYQPTGKSPLEDHPTFPQYQKKFKALLIHGWGNSSEDPGCLGGVQRALEQQGVEVVFPDLSFAQDYDFEKAMHELCAYDVDIVVGHSTGGYLAMQYASTRDCHCVLIAPTIDTQSMKQIEKISPIEFSSKNVFDFHNTEINFEQLNQEKISLFFGKNDGLIDQRFVDVFAQKLPSSSFGVLPNRGHMGSIEGTDTIEEINAYIIDQMTKLNSQTYTRECDTLDTFMCSSFYFLRFPDVDNDDELIRKELADKMFPIDFYIGGKEHTVGHLLYSRFIHKFLFDQGYVSSAEPFAKLVHQGMVLGADGRKMGKRYGNGVDPLEVIGQYGTDAVRMYLMFMGPVESDKPWSDTALNGVAKFLKRVHALLDMDWRNTKNDAVESIIHETIQGVSHDIDRLKLNTCVSKLMICVNTIYEHTAVTDEQLQYLAQLMAPFATETASKIWEATGGEGDVHLSNRPVADESKIQTSTITLPIQINGKMRGNMEITAGLSEQEVVTLAKEVENIAKRLAEGEIKKIIWVQDKILNLIVK